MLPPIIKGLETGAAMSVIQLLIKIGFFYSFFLFCSPYIVDLGWVPSYAQGGYHRPRNHAKMTRSRSTNHKRAALHFFLLCFRMELNYIEKYIGKHQYFTNLSQTRRNTFKSQAMRTVLPNRKTKDIIRKL